MEDQHKDGLRDVSKANWCLDTRQTIGAPGILDKITAGSLQHIADSMEKMVADYDRLKWDCEWQKSLAERRLGEIHNLYNTIKALRGWTSRYKSIIKHLKFNLSQADQDIPDKKRLRNNLIVLNAYPLQ